MRKYACLGLLLALDLATAPAKADPRYWRHDRALTAGPGARSVPDVAFAGLGTRFVVWQEDDPTRGAEIYLTASFDSGCSWCGPVLWATGPGDESLPRLDAGFTPGGNYSVQVVFRRGSSEVLVAGDASILGSATPADACAAFAALATPSPVSIAAGPSVSRPRIAAAGGAGVALHFHATWSSEVGPTERVIYAHDLAGDGSGWLTDPALDLFATLGEIGVDPDIAADTLASAGPDTAATIMYRDSDGRVKMTRSTDSGLTWSAPFGVSLTTALDHSIDSTTSELGDPAVWNGAVWQTSPPTVDVRLDAAHWTDPLARDPDFNVHHSDHLVGEGAEPALAIGPSLSPSDFPYPLFVFWQRDSEIVSRGGNLDAFEFLPRNLDSIGQPHSNCVWSESWPDSFDGECEAGPRPAGSSARSVAAADALDPDSPAARFATVFSDDRAGSSQIYFKESDEVLASTPTITGTTAACEGLGRAAVELSFVTVPTCPSAPELMERYLAYYGSVEEDGASPTGPFRRRAELAAAGLTDPAVFRIGALIPGWTYHFALIPEDEARNLSPADFWPRVSTNVVPAAQLASIVMPADCLGSCLVPAISPIVELKAAKSDRDIRFTWSADPAAGEYHLNGVAAKTSISEPEAHRPGLGSATPICRTAATACEHTDGLSDPASPLFYQLFGACGPDGAEEGPL